MKKKHSVVIGWYRFEHFLYVHNMRFLSNCVYHIMQILFGCSIPPSVILEGGVDIPHYHGIVIHKDTIVHSGTLIYQNVTIGGNGKTWGAEIGQDCFIGSGACILGKIKIGNNVKIGANAVVLRDIPDDCTVVGVPARIIERS